MKNIFAFAFIISLTAIYSCNDGSVVGNDLLDNEILEIGYGDGFLLTGQTIKGDSVPTNLSGAQTYLLGEIEEPVFGYYSSDVYTALSFRSILPDYVDATLDSVVLELEYDSLGFYGNPSSSMDFEVFRVLEDFASVDTLMSNMSFDTDMMPIGSYSAVPDFTTEILTKARIEDVDSFVVIPARLRIRLDDSFGEELLMDEDAASSDSALIENIKGLYIKATVPSKDRIIGLNFNEDTDFNDGIAKLAVYYTQPDDDGVPILREYNYFLRPDTHSEFIHDFSGSTVENAIAETTGETEYLFVQNLAGSNAEITLPDLSQLKGNLINAAELTLTINEEDSEFQTDLFPPSLRYLLSKYDNETGDRTLVDDLIKGTLSLSNALILFGGTAVETEQDDGSTIKTVTFNITDYIDNVVKNDGEESTMIITPIGRQQSPRRTVFYGTNHPEYPAKLRIAYTVK